MATLVCMCAAAGLQVEQLDEVERAFVHVDYMRRDGLEHKVSRGRDSLTLGLLVGSFGPCRVTVYTLCWSLPVGRGAACC